MQRLGHGIHRGLCQRHRKGNGNRLHRSRAPGAATALLRGCWRAAGWAEPWPPGVPHSSRPLKALVLLAVGVPLTLCLCLCGCQDKEEQKMLFLSKICALCRTVTEKGLSLDLHAFCCKNKLVENLMVRGCAAGWGRGKALRHQPPGRLGQCWRLQGLIPLVLYRRCWKRSPWTGCAQNFGRRPWRLSPSSGDCPAPGWASTSPGQCPGGPEAGREAAHPSRGCLAKGGPCPPS